jgi:putative ABC transport system substrate-binding protein
MKRRVFLGVISGGLLAAPLVAGAQTAAKKVRVGMLGSNPMPSFLYEMFKQGLAQLGYIEGHQVQIVQLDGGGVPARLPARAAELVRAKADVIFARGPFAVAAAVEASKTIPIVAIDLESDPIALGYAKTLARPGGNVTGVFLDLPELSAKQLQLFWEIAPGLSRVALVGDSTGNAAQFRAAERAAQTLGIQVQMFENRTAAELDAALEAAPRSGVGAVLSSPVVLPERGCGQGLLPVQLLACGHAQSSTCDTASHARPSPEGDEPPSGGCPFGSYFLSEAGLRGHNRSRGPCFGMCHEPQPEPLASAKTLGGLPTKHQGQSWLAAVKAATSRAVPLHFNEVLSIVLHPEDTEVAKSLNTGRDM